jgi:hypothetical protein
MRIKLLKTLPWIAVSMLAVAILALIFYSGRRTLMLQESQETRQAALAALAQFEKLKPSSILDPDLRELMDEVIQQPYVATLWLISSEGEIVYSVGSTAMQGTLRERATNEMKSALESLPPDQFSQEQTLMLLAASAIRSEGEHNDVYRHLVRPLASSAGAPLGLVGMAYDVSPQVGAVPAIGEIISLLLLALSLGLYWLSLPLWVYLDARQRGERTWVWAVFVLMGNLAALLAYLLARAPLGNEPAK